MHRLLVAHEKSQVCVYSLNKNEKIQEISFEQEDISSKGKILACEWLYSDSSKESTSFAIGFSEGSVEIYKAESKSLKPTKFLNFDVVNLLEMRLLYQERTGEPMISIIYS